jgi:hypothetical protein
LERGNLVPEVDQRAACFPDLTEAFCRNPEVPLG